MNEPAIRDWALLYLIRLGHKNLNLVFGGGYDGAFGLLGPIDFGAQRAEEAGQFKKEWEKKGAIVAQGGDAMMGPIGGQGGGGTGLWENFTCFDPHDRFSTEGTLEFFRACTEYGRARKWGPPMENMNGAARGEDGHTTPREVRDADAPVIAPSRTSSVTRARSAGPSTPTTSATSTTRPSTTDQSWAKGATRTRRLASSTRRSESANGTAIFTAHGGAPPRFQPWGDGPMIGQDVPIPVAAGYLSFRGTRPSAFADLQMRGEGCALPPHSGVTRAYGWPRRPVRIPDRCRESRSRRPARAGRPPSISAVRRTHVRKAGNWLRRSDEQIAVLGGGSRRIGSWRLR